MFCFSFLTLQQNNQRNSLIKYWKMKNWKFESPPNISYIYTFFLSYELYLYDCRLKMYYININRNYSLILYFSPTKDMVPIHLHVGFLGMPMWDHHWSKSVLKTNGISYDTWHILIITRSLFFPFKISNSNPKPFFQRYHKTTTIFQIHRRNLSPIASVVRSTVVGK